MLKERDLVSPEQSSIPLRCEYAHNCSNADIQQGNKALGRHLDQQIDAQYNSKGEEYSKL
jgi:hypothetical protein